jgi:hypothetical protein
MITQAQVRELFDYVDGVLVYRADGLRTKAGNPVGWHTGNGYLRTDIAGKKYYVHRVVWVYHNGPCDWYLVDHADGNKQNNRIENLRLGDKSSNGLNRRRARKDSTSNLLGVLSGRTRRGTPTYQARLTVRGTTINLGNHKTAEDAHRTYVHAKKLFLGE